MPKISIDKIPKKQIKIVTIHPMYDVIEDRIRLSFNHKQNDNHIDLMMSRRFLLQLLPSFEEYMYKVYEEELKTLDLTSIPQNKNKRLGNHSQLQPHQHNALLLEGIEFSYIEKTKQTLLNFHAHNTKVYVRLEATALVEIFGIIRSTVPYFDWGISPRL